MIRCIFTNSTDKTVAKSYKTMAAALRAVRAFLVNDSAGHVTVYDADGIEFFDVSNLPE